MSGTCALRLGFMPLIDAAIPIVAADKGFAALRGIDLQLVRETSWANIRDRIAIGHFEAAQLLAPMPIAANLGLTPLEAPLIAPLSLGPGANAITVSSTLYARMRASAPDMVINDPASVGAALKAVVAGQGDRRLHFAVVHPHSAQNYVLRYWLAACGIAPDIDVDIGILPPPLMPDALGSGMVDGFCVGEPWNARAVHQGHGRIVLTKVAIWREGPEKVLGFRRDYAQKNPAPVQALLGAMLEAAAWCRAVQNRAELVDILSRVNRLNLPATDIESGLQEGLPLADGTRFALDPFGLEAALRPDKGAAGWFFNQMVRWGQAADTPDNRTKALAAYRPDLLPGDGQNLAEQELAGQELAGQELAGQPGGFFDRA